MRRKANTILPLEQSILEAGIQLRGLGTPLFHGFLIAHEIKEHEGARMLTAHGTLYKALGRMEKAGLLESRWEDADISVDEGRPRRKLYEVTALGETALTKALGEQKASVNQGSEGGFATA